MKRNLMIYFVIFSVVFLAGCNDLKKVISLKETQPSAPEPLIQYLDDQELAKIILRPEKKKLKISRDPFKPIITKEKTGPDASLGFPQDDLQDMILIGVIRMDDEFHAYVKTSNKTGVLKLQDKIRDYTVEYIDANQIILKSGDKEVVKKRGKK